MRVGDGVWKISARYMQATLRTVADGGQVNMPRHTADTRWHWEKGNCDDITVMRHEGDSVRFCWRFGVSQTRPRTHFVAWIRSLSMYIGLFPLPASKVFSTVSSARHPWHRS